MNRKPRPLALLAALLVTACTGNPDPGPDAGPVDAGDPCLAQCEALTICAAVDGARCAEYCALEAVNPCLVAAANCVAAEVCLESVPPPVVRPFSQGPYGTGKYDVVGPFTLDTRDGPLDFEAGWTGAGSWIFALQVPGNSTSTALWGSKVGAFFETAPPDTHLVIIATNDPDGTDNAASHMEDRRLQVETYLSGLDDAVAEQWRAQVHYVTTSLQNLTGPVRDVFAAWQSFGFAIDPTQRLRELGLISAVGGGPELRFFATPARYFAWELKRDAALNPDDTLVPLFQDAIIESSQIQTFTIPDLTAFDHLEVDLTLACPPDRLDTDCGEWDYIANLHLCDVNDVCDVEVGRWITPYHREGRWVTDLTPLLPRWGTGGTQKIRFSAPKQPNGTQYLVSATLRVRDDGGPRPRTMTDLFQGGPFDATYNDKYTPLSIDIPTSATKVALVAFITGHGFGKDTENCAEFCNHTHHFTVNGTEYVVDHPEADIPDGCLQQIDEGVVPNQYGTWPFGRGGWCPGLDVAPHVFDVTADVTPGQAATITYEGRLAGQPYVPVPRDSGQGFGAQINMKSWLVAYE